MGATGAAGEKFKAPVQQRNYRYRKEQVSGTGTGNRRKVLRIPVLLKDSRYWKRVGKCLRKVSKEEFNESGRRR